MMKNRALKQMLGGAFCLLSATVFAKGDGMIPFLAITGKPTEVEVRAKVATIAEQGIESFLVYARSGLELEYMGEDWLRLTEWFCDEAARRGMKVWLYDEYNWPSGTCKGRVPNENDAWRYMELGVYRNPDGSYRWATALAPGGWVNVYEPAAVDRFIELTHEVYARRLKKWFDDKTVLGIFTDEPGHPTTVTFEEGRPIISFRNYTGLEAEYRAATGRALRADVERWLEVRRTDPAAAKRSPAADVWAVYTDLVGKRFRASYFDRIRAWCDRKGILLTGHMISEDHLPGSARCNGNPILCLRGESLPGMDEIRTAYDAEDKGRTAIEWVTYNVARQAILHRGNGGLVELYACGPADHTPATLRSLLWQCAFHGIDHYITCMDVMDERGLVEKHGYLSCTGPINPWYERHARVLADEARTAARWARKTVSEREVAVRYPNAAAARAAYTGAKSPDVAGLLRMLEVNQYTCRFIDEGEASDLPLVFVCHEDGTFSEEKTVEKGLSSADALALCRRTLKTSVEVLDADGAPADQLLLRVYSDGSAAVLSLQTFGERRLTVVRNGEKTAFTLPGRGVKLFPAGPLPPGEAVCTGVRSLKDVKWSLSLDAPNLHRVNFSKEKKGVLKVSEGVKGIRLVTRELALSYAVTGSGRPVGLNEKPAKGEKVLRHIAEPYAFELDGRRVADSEACDRLRPCYNTLYRQTAELELAAGEHGVAIVSGEADQNFYLPALFVAGDFAVRDGVLAPRSQEKVGYGSLASYGLAGFTGTATWCADVTAPKEAGTHLRLTTGGRVTRVSFCGRNLGVRAWMPFTWEVPADLAGRTGPLEISVSTSVMPMLGDVTRGVWDMRFWFDVHCPDGPCGLYDVSWCTMR